MLAVREETMLVVKVRLARSVEEGGAHVECGEVGGHVVWRGEAMLARVWEAMSRMRRKTKLIVGGPHVECGDQISLLAVHNQSSITSITFGPWAPSACWGLQGADPEFLACAFPSLCAAAG